MLVARCLGRVHALCCRVLHFRFEVAFYGAAGGLKVPVPYVPIRLAGYSATAAGAALLPIPIPIVIAFVSPTLGRIAGRLGRCSWHWAARRVARIWKGYAPLRQVRAVEKHPWRSAIIGCTLRVCRRCGRMGCCDESPGRNATKHFQATQHPIIEGYAPPAGWL